MIVIIGAGITGLSFANFCKNNDYKIIEQEYEPGGYCRTIFQDGFTWDYSGHFFHFRNSEIKDYLLRRIDSEVLEIVKKSQIYINGNYIDFPFQKNIHQLPKNDFIDCLYDLYFKDNCNSKNFYEMLYTKFGNAISHMFLIPYNEKLYACDLRDLDQNAMGRFFPNAEVDDVIRNFKHTDNTSYNSTFTYPRGGAIEYIKALMKDININSINLGEKLIKIDLRKKIIFTDKNAMKYDSLISTIPFNKLLDAVDIKYDKSLYTYNKVLVFNLGFDLESVTMNHWIYYPNKDIVFYRVGFYDNIFREKKMSLYVEIGLASNEKFDLKEKLEKVLKDLQKVGIINGHRLISWKALVLDPAYVHIKESAKKDYAEKNKLLKNYGVYSIGRYGGWKYCSIEDNIIEAKELALNV